MDFHKHVENEMSATAPIILDYPWADKNCYGMWLAQTYYMVSHSTRLVALAGARCPIDRNDLHARFVDHSAEERGHEKVCISDIKAIGKNLTEFPKIPQSQAMFQVQYYWVEHVSPVSFFGYTYALEMLAAKFGPEVYRQVKSAHGENAAKFLKLHSDADTEHMAKADQMISKLNEDELNLATENLILSAQLYRQMLIEGPKVIRAQDPKFQRKTA